MHTQAIVDQCSHLHLHRQISDDAKVQPRRREDGQIARIGKKWEHYFARPRQPYLGCKRANLHSSLNGLTNDESRGVQPRNGLSLNYNENGKGWCAW